MHIRPAVEADLKGIAEAHVESWRDAYRGLIPDWYLASLSVEEREERWRLVLDEGGPRSGLLVLEDVGREETGPTVAGFAHLQESRDDDADPSYVGEVSSFYLRKSFWRQGGGTALLAAATEALQAAGFTEATLWVLEGNDRARRFYESQGWQLNGTRGTDTRRGFQVQEVRYRRSLTPSPSSERFGVGT